MPFDLVSRLLFPTPPTSYTVESFPEELIWVPKNMDPTMCSPEECVPCLFLPYSSARFLIFYLHSNAEDIGRCYPFCSSVRAQFQVHVLAVEYPGYGICPGGPCDERRVTENAFSAFRFVREVIRWPLDSILILGRSIGCGPAISLAVRYQVSGCIVVSPMISLKEACRDAVGPLAYLVEDRFPNKDRVAFIRSPFLVVHGQKDLMIPCRHGVELYRVCRSRKLLVCPQDMEHNTNLLANVTYFVLPMLQFFSLPDYCFEDIVVPKWAYDKRMCPYYRDSPDLPWTSPPELDPSRQSTPGELPDDSCETPTQPTFGCLTCPAMRRSSGAAGAAVGGVRARSKEEPDAADGEAVGPADSLNWWLFGGQKAGAGATSALDSQHSPWSLRGGGDGGGRLGDGSGALPDLALGAAHGCSAGAGPRTCAATDKPGVTSPPSTLVHTIRRNIPRVVPPPAAPPPPAPPPTPQTVCRPLAFEKQPGESNGAVAAVAPRETAERALGDPLPEVQERTASRNRFQESTCTTTSGEAPSQWAEGGAPSDSLLAVSSGQQPLGCLATSLPSTPPSPGPRSPPSPGLLSQDDFAEIVEDLERHFAREERQRVAHLANPGALLPPAGTSAVPLAWT